MLQKNVKYLLSYAIFALSLTPAVHAQTNETQLESIGLFDTTHKYSLGSGIYHKSSRAALTKLLENTKTSQWIALNRELNHFLLTSADVSSLNNDIVVPIGKDLFTMRLNALLNRGLNKQAFELFSKIPDGTTLRPLAYPGVLSMLLNKQKALACLEAKVLTTDLKNDQFWLDLDAYCTISLSKQTHAEKQNLIQQSSNKILGKILSNERFTFEYTPTTFAALSPLERAILTAENKITLQKAYKKTPPQDIAPLLQQTDIDDETRVVLTIQAIKHGVFEFDALTDLFEKLNEQSTLNKSIEEIISLYEETKEVWLPKRRKSKIEQAFILADKYDDIILIPFLPVLMKMEPGDDISLVNAKRSVALFLYTDLQFPSKWIEYLQEITIDDKNYDNLEKVRSQTLLAATILAKPDNSDVIKKADNIINSYTQLNMKMATLKNITYFIDINTSNNDKVQYIYENDFDLIENKSYTMPPSIVMDTLRQSSTKQDIGVTLLLSNAILSGIENKELYPGTLGDISIALSKIGSKKLSHRILAQAILEIEN